MTERTGRCLCGAVSFSATGVRPRFGGCHCRMCQRWSGASFLALTVTGIDWQGTEHIATFRSSDWAERAWCAACGSHLWYRVTAQGGDTTGGSLGEYEVPIGLFDDAEGFEMTREIFIDRKPDAYAFAGARERLTEAETLALYAPGDGGA